MSRSPCVIFLVLAALALSGCGKFRKTRECANLVEVVSTWLREAPRRAPEIAEPEELVVQARATAAHYRELDKRLQGLHIESVELVPHVRRYREMAKQSERTLEDVARSLEQEDADSARRRRVEFDRTARAEAPLVAEINEACRR